MTRLILATQPWSHVAMTEVVICAMPKAIASPFVVIRTTWISTWIEVTKHTVNMPCEYHDLWQNYLLVHLDQNLWQDYLLVHLDHVVSNAQMGPVLLVCAHNCQLMITMVHHRTCQKYGWAAFTEQWIDKIAGTYIQVKPELHQRPAYWQQTNTKQHVPSGVQGTSYHKGMLYMN